MHVVSICWYLLTCQKNLKKFKYLLFLKEIHIRLNRRVKKLVFLFETSCCKLDLFLNYYPIIIIHTLNLVLLVENGKQLVFSLKNAYSDTVCVI